MCMSGSGSSRGSSSLSVSLWNSGFLRRGFDRLRAVRFADVGLEVDGVRLLEAACPVEEDAGPVDCCRLFVSLPERLGVGAGGGVGGGGGGGTGISSSSVVSDQSDSLKVSLTSVREAAEAAAVVVAGAAAAGVGVGWG